MNIKLVDCTFRDGGYYNNWDFEEELIKEYLLAMESIKIDFVEIGFRSLKNDNFNGALAYSSDLFLKKISIPKGLRKKIGVMINGSEIANPSTQLKNLKKLFRPKVNSPVSLVRVACHVDEFYDCLPASKWLKKQGYLVGFNIMQVADRSIKEINQLANAAVSFPIDVLYFADSMGSLDSNKLENIINAFKKNWKKDLGIHTHDNIGQAVNNSIQAIKSGIKWVDSTVTGMGRGPGNAQTEYIILALANYRKKQLNLVKILRLIDKYFKPMKQRYNWGISPFYFLAGQHNIHPSYIQYMVQDSRYSEEDILSVIDFLKVDGGKKFNLKTLETARHFYSKTPKGKWSPQTLIKNKTVLILGSGPGIKKYRSSLEEYIKQKKPFVIALNTQSDINQGLINARVACHPVRLLADLKEHIKLSQPLITPFSMLPETLKKNLLEKEILDYGITLNKGFFKYHENYCEVPSSLVITYTLALVNSGKANEVKLAGFDGYKADDPRSEEMRNILEIYNDNPKSLPLQSITPTNYKISKKSIFGLNF
jgi:4-hydroxy 2-oxovalerate aldolase